jgi:hypothetical protein
MKRYYAVAVHEEGGNHLLGQAALPVYLASDVDRLREEARKRVAAYMVNEQGYVETYASEVADRILAEVFKGVG